MSKPIISETGEIHGRGSDPYKWVSYLTDAERQAARNGEIVLVKTPYTHPAATEYKQVIYSRNGNYYHRNYYGEIYP